MEQYCGRCGQKNPPQGKYCSKCGAPLKRRSAAQIAAQSEPLSREKFPEKKRKTNRKKVLLSIGILVVFLAVSAGILFYLSARQNSRFESVRAEILKTKNPEYNIQMQALSREWNGTFFLSLMDRRRILEDLEKIHEQSVNAESVLADFKTENTPPKDTSEAIQILEDASGANQSEQPETQSREDSMSEPSEKDVLGKSQQLRMSVQQIDTKSFPKTKLYVSIRDSSDKTIAGLDPDGFYIEKADASGNLIRQDVSQAIQLDQKESLRIDLVVDVSSRMRGTALSQAQDAMESFIKTVQFSAGDLVELTDSSRGVYISREFSNDSDYLISGIKNITAEDSISLYDALYTAISRAAAQSGAKCVIALTDGIDNYSNCTPDTVISLARRYKVPIHLIGIGDTDQAILKDISNRTDGTYYYADSAANLSGIYQKIYQKEKNQYLLSFSDSTGINIDDTSSIHIGYQADDYYGECDYVFEPKVLIKVEDNEVYQNGPEAVVEQFVKGYAKAQTNSDFTYIEPYMMPGSKIYSDMKDFVNRTFSVYLNSYEIVDTDYSDSNNCFVTVYETYSVQKTSEPLYLMTQKSKYHVVKGNNGWKITEFAEPVEVISEVNQ